MNKTINDHISDLQAKFAALSPATKRALKRKAQEYCSAKPAMANASNFWRGLSAQQVLACK